MQRERSLKTGDDEMLTYEGEVVLARRVITDSEMEYTTGYVKEALLRTKDSEITISIRRGKGQVKDMPS